MIGEQLAARDSRVEFRRHTVNRGHISTYNEGLLEWSTAEYVVLLSADDQLTPECLRRATRIMNADRRIGMVYGRPIYFETESELPTITPGPFTYTRFSGSEWLEGRCKTALNVISSPEVVVRGSVQRAVGGYSTSLPHAGDLEMWLRIAAVSDIAYVRRIPQAFYRVHQKSMLRTKYRTTLLDLQQRKEAFDMFFSGYKDPLGKQEAWQQMANRALAREALWDACRAWDHNRVQAEQADELAHFAAITYKATSSLPEFRALARRRLLGANICKRTQFFAPPALLRRAKGWLRQQRWKHQGV
jgi:glycosyltransferase involved in cell wall biosynthesis